MKNRIAEIDGYIGQGLAALKGTEDEPAPTPAAPTPCTLDNMVNRAPLRASGCVNHPREEADRKEVDATTPPAPTAPEKNECRQCSGYGSTDNPDREEAQFVPRQPCYHCSTSGVCGCDFCTLTRKQLEIRAEIAAHNQSLDPMISYSDGELDEHYQRSEQLEIQQNIVDSDAHGDREYAKHLAEEKNSSEGSK